MRDNGIGMTPRRGRRRSSARSPSPAPPRCCAKLREAREAGSVGRGRADRPVRRRLLLQLHGRRPGHAGHPQGGQRTPGVRWESTRRGHLHHRAEAPDAPQGTAVTLHLKPEDTEDAPARLHRTRRRSARSSSATRTSSPGRSGWPTSAPSGEDDAASRDRQLPEGAVGAPAERGLRRGVHRVLPARQPRLAATRWRPSGCRPRAPSSTRRCCSCPATRRWTCSCARRKRGVQLYVKRVFIMDDCEALVPEYLRFVKGVVDAHDLSLNISREILQQDRQIQLIRKRLVKKVLSTVKTMLADEPEKYATFWTEFGRAVKEGLLSDHDNRDAILEICSFPSTHDAGEADHPARLPRADARGPGRASTTCTGESRSALENSPHMEAFRAKGYEVLLLTDPVDEVWVDAVPDVRGQAARLDRQGRGRPRRRRRRRRHQAGLRRPADLDGGDAGGRRQGGAALAPAHHLGGVPGRRRPATSRPTLEKMYRAMGQELPKVKRILELNPKHALVTGLRDAHAARPDDPGLADTARPALRHGAARRGRRAGRTRRVRGAAVAAAGADAPARLMRVSPRPGARPAAGAVVPAHGRHRGDRRGEPADVGPGVRRQHHRHHRDARAGVGGHPRRRAGDRAGRARDVRARGLRGRADDRAVRRPSRAAPGVDDGGRAGLRRGGGPGGRPVDRRRWPPPYRCARSSRRRCWRSAWGSRTRSSDG